MKRYGYWKKVNQRKLVLSMGAFLVSLSIVAVLLFLPVKKTDETKVNAEKALMDLREICGESHMETLADLEEAQRSADPEEYLLENSVFVLDEEALDRYIQTYLAGAESAALAAGISMDALVVDNWGYESLGAYQDAVGEEAKSFIKKRLAVFEAAKVCHITLETKEYEKLLGSYAQRFSYDSVEEFTMSCVPETIANEMLYDKTVARIQEGKAV